MFSAKVVLTDKFTEMPLSSQCLYFHLGMQADDDGFVDNPKSVIRSIGANDDDLKLLIYKGFIIPFKSGIVVIVHWNINNSIRKDRKKETLYESEKRELLLTKSNLYLLDDGSNTDKTYMTSTCQPNDNQVATKCPHSIGEYSIGEYSIDKGSVSIDLVEKENTPTPPLFSNNCYGEFKNISLSDEEYTKLSKKLEHHLEIMIDKLSRYIKSSGKDYKSHYATLLTWYDEDKEKLNKQNKTNTEYNPHSYSDITL